jgi:hypothetical protein
MRNALVEFLGPVVEDEKPRVDLYRVRYMFGSMNQWQEDLLDSQTYQLMRLAYEAGKNDLRYQFRELVRIT